MTPGKIDSDFKSVISEHMLLIEFMNTAYDNALRLMPSQPWCQINNDSGKDIPWANGDPDIRCHRARWVKLHPLRADMFLVNI